MNLKAFRCEDLPLSDSCWSLTSGADGKIYFAACTEHTGGVGAFICRYDPDAERLDVMRDIAADLNEPPDSGRATQCKIHYCLVPARDGKLWGATHASGPPMGDIVWRPWQTWDDHRRMFSGFHIFCWDPATDEFRDYGAYQPNEGCRAMALAEERGKLYGVTWPRDHFWVFDIATECYRDLGRIGDINPQAIWIDRDENAYTTDDFGCIVKYEVDADRLRHLEVRLPHAPFRDGTHNLVYDAVPSPDGESIYGTTWSYDHRLFRYDLYDGPDGRMHDLGRWHSPESPEWNVFYDLGHCGGLVFGDDGWLYAGSRVAWKEPHGSYLIRYHPETGVTEELGRFEAENMSTYVISRGSKDYAGRLYFGDVGTRPTGIYVYTPEGVEPGPAQPRWPLARPWG